MTKQSKYLTILRPDDWHIHFRDGEILKKVVPYTSAIYARAIVMPNLIPPITTIKAAVEYRERILKAVPKNHNFVPLITCYLTDSLNPNEVEKGFNENIFIAAKLYPSTATVNSNDGVNNLDTIMPILERMEKLGMPLLVHGEVTNTDVDIFDREARFIDTVMEPLHRRFPELKLVFEHITTKEASEYVGEADKYLAATITPQHLMFNRNDMFLYGIRPHLYCLPILKRNIHQKALREFATSGFSRVFIGTDSAPHVRRSKESDYGCAGCFNTLTSLANYATVFDEMNALENFEAFCSINGPRFYGLPINTEKVFLVRQEYRVPKYIHLSDDELIPFLSNEKVDWTVKNKYV